MCYMSDAAICSWVRTKAAQRRSGCAERGCCAACRAELLCMCSVGQTRRASGCGGEAPLTCLPGSWRQGLWPSRSTDLWAAALAWSALVHPWSWATAPTAALAPGAEGPEQALLAACQKGVSGGLQLLAAFFFLTTAC